MFANIELRTSILLLPFFTFFFRMLVGDHIVQNQFRHPHLRTSTVRGRSRPRDGDAALAWRGALGRGPAWTPLQDTTACLYLR